RSTAHDGCVSTGSMLSRGSSSISRASGPVPDSPASLLVGRDVVDCLPDRLDLLGVVVRDLDPELILELHYQLDQIQRVGVQVLLKGSLVRDLAVVDAERLGQDFLDTLEDLLARSGHLTSTWGRGHLLKNAPIIHGAAQRAQASAPRAFRPLDARRRAPRAGPRSRS